MGYGGDRPMSRFVWVVVDRGWRIWVRADGVCDLPSRPVMGLGLR